MQLRNFLLAFLCVFSLRISAQSTASQQVDTFSIEAPQLKTKKKIWVYIPKSYKNSEKSYSVIYMHDAQNLFDATTSYVGEWKVDEYLDSISEDETIIVGIEHGNEKRIDELTPYPHEKYGGGKGDAYLGFIIETLKPKIDSSYRTFSDVKHTSIWGSSLGGLISLYAVVKYPKTFGKAGVFSPAIWINKKEMLEFLKGSTIDSDKKFYFLVGSEEGQTAEDASQMVADQHEMVQLLKNKGVPEKNIIDKVIPNGHHNEILWSTNFPEAYQWLIKE
ncbi:MAG: alpha/beta hydrolase-fold protein [Gelidibacter sp.]